MLATGSRRSYIFLEVNMAESDPTEIKRQIEELRLDLEVNDAYYDRRIQFLEAIDRVLRLGVFLSSSAAAVAFFNLFYRLDPWFSGIVGTACALLIALLSHVKEGMDTKLNIFRYKALKKASSKLDHEILRTANIGENELIKFQIAQSDIDADEPPSYVIVYYLVRNEIVKSHNLRSAELAVIPWWRRLLAHYAFQSGFDPVMVKWAGNNSLANATPAHP
jgi:hypothetical protein